MGHEVLYRVVNNFGGGIYAKGGDGSDADLTVPEGGSGALGYAVKRRSSGSRSASTL